MLFAIIAFIHSVEFTATAEQIVCDGLVFHDVYFDKETLVSNLGRPYNLVVHKFSGTLFFSHTVQQGSAVDFAIVSCSIDKKDCREVSGIPGGYAIAYDAGNDDMYFGGHNGIYKYNFLNKSAEFFAEEGKSIWGLFIRKNFYYIEYPSQKLFVYEDDQFGPVAEAMHIEIDNFFVTKPGDVYFSNQTALYKVEKATKITMVLSDEIMTRQIVEDKYGDLYFCSNNGIYIEEKPYHRIKKIASINKGYGLAFDDSDNVIYSDVDSIYRLLPSKVSDVCYDKLKGNVRDENMFKDHLIS